MRNKFQKFNIGLKALVKCGNEILIIKTSARGDWEVPGGRIDEGENHEQVLAREIFEETGMKLNLENKKLRYVNIDTYEDYAASHSGCKLCLIFYEVEIESKPEVKLSHEHVDYKWITKEEIVSFKIHKQLRHAFSKLD
jgi:8-oxo-dGTP diphosphatase